MAPALDETPSPQSAVTAVLHQEHQWIREALNLLEVVAHRLDAGELVPPQAVAQLLVFMREFGDQCHHAKEEEVLLPFLRERGVHVPPKVEEEHDKSRRLLKTLDQQAPTVAHDEQARQRFVHTALGYVAATRDHIEHENRSLYPAADRLMQDDAVRLLSAFQLFEVQAVGERAHDKYRALLDQAAQLLTPQR
jgi:hemerythrin-like domain-containing protein